MARNDKRYALLLGYSITTGIGTEIKNIGKNRKPEIYQNPL